MVDQHLVLIYYQYKFLENPAQLCVEQKKLCTLLNLKGRVIVAHEGINATLGGTYHDITHYITIMKSHEPFSAIDFKTSPASDHSFPRLRIVLRNQIVGWGTKIADPLEAGTHLDPEQTHQLLQQKSDELVVFDARNDYESRIGQFQNALIPSIECFRQLPDYIDDHLEQFKDKIVVMYCTSGVRCERASAYLKTKNIAKAVYQIQGGIQRYTQQYPKGFFKGKNYVFDARGAIAISQDILSSCDLCSIACNDYSNCINAQCNEQFIACVACKTLYKESCSASCKTLVETNSVNLRAPGGVRRSVFNIQNSKKNISLSSERKVAE